MPFRPTSIHRKNIKGVIYPLTAAIARMYGIRNDGAYPIGAFYTVNIDRMVWRYTGGIWYQPTNPESIENRIIREEDIELFFNGIANGEDVQLRSGTIITWEEIPEEQASLLPTNQC